MSSAISPVKIADYTSLPALPIMQTTYPLHKYLQMDQYYKHMTVDVNSFHAL